MHKLLTITWLVLFSLAAVVPLGNLVLWDAHANLVQLRDIASDRWITGNQFHPDVENNDDPGCEVIDESINPELSMIERFDGTGTPIGRSFPPEGIGPGVIVDGSVEGDSFWAYQKYAGGKSQVPIGLTIRCKKPYDASWVCLIPRSTWQIALQVNSVIRSGNDVSYSILVPKHYLGGRPVIYRFRSQQVDGIQFAFSDAKVTAKTTYWVSIYEIGSGP